MVIYILIFIIIVSFFTLYFLINKLCNIVVFPKTKSYETTYKSQVENLNLHDFFNNVHKEKIKIKSPYGYDLNGYFIPNGNCDKVIVICHGITANLYSSIKYMKIFHDKGFSALIYDHRNHGQNIKTYSSMGNFEKYDLKACVDWLYTRIDHKFIFGVHGESMGAGTVIEYCGIDNRASFCIEDCGYSDVSELLKKRLKEDYHLPIPALVSLANVLMKFKYKWTFSATAPVNTVKNLTLPILFIHGSNDNYVPTYMVNKLFENKNKGYKDIYICDNAGHALSYTTNPEEYKRRVYNFLDKIGIS